MRRFNIWLVIVVFVGFLGYQYGRMSRQDFEFSVHVEPSGVTLEAVRGCAWESATFSGPIEGTHTFVVSRQSVRSP